MIKKKRSIKVFLMLFVLVLFLILFLFSVVMIFIYFKDNYHNKKIKETILEEHVEVISPTDDSSDVYKVDFDALKKVNPDTIAYLKVFGTNIDYVVVRGEDNSYYLKHNFYRDWNVSGWIFSDYRNSFDGSDQNIVIFGHNTLDGSMFGSLSNVLSDEWRNHPENLQIVLVTEMGTYFYQVFSTYITDVEDFYIQTSFSPGEFVPFINTLKERSSHSFDVSINDSDSILTLSSCNKSGSKRIVLHAILLS